MTRCLVWDVEANDARFLAQFQRIQSLEQQQQAQSQSLAALKLDEQSLTSLKRKLSSLERRLSASPRSVAHNTAVKRKVARKPKSSQPPITPSFVLFDVQQRGRVLLAVVGSAHASRLSELTALRVGQRYQGWQVTNISQSSIQAERQGQKVVMEVQA